MSRYYAGVGSRKTPPEVCQLMTRCAVRLREGYGFILRSGGAQGADLAFEAGAADQKEIFLANDSTPEALALAASIHPAWSRCSPYARLLHARNCFQILGADLSTPVEFVVCWTPCGSEVKSETTRQTGGTRTAIVLANLRGIPVFNMARPHALLRVSELLNGNKEENNS